METKEYDVYKFRFSPKKEQGWDHRYHCFEGYLIARPDVDGWFRFVDIYWGIGGDGKSFTEEEIKKEVTNGGKFEFYFNLNEVEPIQKYDVDYYDDADLYSISEQHACVDRYVHHYKRKGAEKSQQKMLSVLKSQMQLRKSDIEIAVREVESLAQKINRVESGDLTTAI